MTLNYKQINDINYIRGRYGLFPFSNETILKIIYTPLDPLIIDLIKDLPYEIRLKCKILCN